MKISVLIGWMLLWAGISDVLCICGDRWSQHDFDSLTPAGFCQSGDFTSGCSCMQYEPKGLRPKQDRRGDPSTWR